MNKYFTKLANYWKWGAFLLLLWGLSFSPDAAANCDSDACPICGDEILASTEQCDDGNLSDGDGCSSTCRSEQEPICGNGILEDAEECDDGNTIDGDSCDSTCIIEAFSQALCGDGMVDVGEECDDGNSYNSDDCKIDCTQNLCGDAELKAGVEECDDGNTIDDDGCLNDCTLSADECPEDEDKNGQDSCDPAHKSIVCHIPPGNPGNAHSICVDNSAVPAHLDHGDSLGECEEECPNENVCGDGELDAGEECDDGNSDDTDDCLNDCTISIEECPNERPPSCDPDHKTTICHFPPGNPDNMQTLCVDNDAVSAHLDHGDSLGECEEDCPKENSASSSNNSSVNAGGCSMTSQNMRPNLFIFIGLLSVFMGLKWKCRS